MFPKLEKKTHPKGQMYFVGPNKTPKWKESSLPISKKIEKSLKNLNIFYKSLSLFQNFFLKKNIISRLSF